MCDYSDAYIVGKGRISVTGTDDANSRHKMLTLRNNVQFKSCISKVSNTFIDNAEGLDIVMPMYNLLEYSDNYSMTSVSLRNYYRDEMNDDVNENNVVGNYRINNNNIKTITSKSFESETKIITCTPDSCCSIRIFKLFLEMS